jgi:hypothetical protein
MSLADLKRRLAVGTTVTMIEHSWYPTGPLIGVPRKVVEVHPTYVVFANPETGQSSRLDFPLSSHLEVTDDGFNIQGDGNLRMAYVFGNSGD